MERRGGAAAAATAAAASSSRAAAAQAGGSGSSSKQSVGAYLAKLRQGDSATWSKDELLNVIYWWRQLSGVILGVTFGAAPVTGFMGVLMFFVISLGVTMTMYKNLLGVDEEEYGGHWELLWEGMPGSFASFMVSWILAYTGMHHAS